MGRKGRSDVLRSVPQRGDVSRNKHAISKRDRERNADGRMEPLEASGGAIVYAGAGARVSVGALGVALGIRRAAARDLNEGPDQQGSEGLERFRAALTVSWSTGL